MGNTAWLLIAFLTSHALAQQDNIFSRANNDTLLWGPYRPNLYFGIRSRLPESLNLGMLWARTDSFEHISPNVRYTCEQHEGMAGYGWDIFDARTGGVQTIHDKGNDIDIETSFVKVEGGAWAARIKGQPVASAGEDMRTSVWFAVSVDGSSGITTDDAEEGEENGFEGVVSFSGSMSDGDFKLKFTAPEHNNHPSHSHPAGTVKPLDRTLVHSLQLPQEHLWQAKPLVYNSVKATFDAYLEEYGQERMPLPYQVWTIQNRPGQGNMHLVQKVFQGPFEFDIVYTQTASEKLSTETVTKQIKDARSSFDASYTKIFKPLAPYTGAKYIEFSKSLFSNLIGGVGFFYGDQVIDRSYASAYEESNEGFWEEAEEARDQNQQKLEGPYELFTSVPSRPFFPRGFLWDEGFHLLPILDWDMDLAMQIVSSWFNTMDEDGWIAREQILGPEARSKVPQEFQVQYPHYANPPTLFMVVEALLDKITGKEVIADTVGNGFGKAEFKLWLTALYPRLKQNFDWYRTTQFGDIKAYDRTAFSTKEAYRWRGRTPRHILTSGLDDYPRPQPPHPGELHVDLLSWMGMTARTLERVAIYLEETEDVARYKKIVEAIDHNVDDLHWDASQKTYCDATIDEYEESVHVCHKGYISLFPFMTGLVGAKHKNLKAILDLIGNENELWSPHGIRSLSRADPAYGTDENYWRSPIWMNMNYLIIKNLHAIGTSAGPHKAQARRQFTALRRNLIDTVYASWKDTGFAWEQYNPETGAGQRTQHFTGWTSLVVKILAMPELPDTDKSEL